MTKKIMIASAIRKENQILKEFLKSLDELEKGDFHIAYCFIDDNEDAESSKLIKDFVGRNNARILKVNNTSIIQDKYICNDITHRWTNSLIDKIIILKNSIIEFFLSTSYEYLFFVDSDLVLHPETLKSLVSQNKDIISNIFWTKWVPNGEELPQVWLKDFYTMYNAHMMRGMTEEEIAKETGDFLNILKNPGVYRIGGLGACTLIKRAPLEKGVNFSEIYNISFWGEDRYFSLRAVAYGYELYVDTHYPAYHIYRIEELRGVKDFKAKYKVTDLEQKEDRGKDIIESNIISTPFIRKSKEKNKLTLSMVVKNEEGRYLEEALMQHRKYIDEAVIIDDGSTDKTVEIIKDILGDKKLILIQNTESGFKNEINLRMQQWRETLKTEPDWILNLDGDEIFERSFNEAIRDLIDRDLDIDGYGFRLYDFWDMEHYRDDNLWFAHRTYRTFLIRYQENFNYKWIETPQHCGRLPYNITDLKILPCQYRLKHYGWAKEEDRVKKYERYMRLDPEGKFGNFHQYKSILDKEPHLETWIE